MAKGNSKHIGKNLRNIRQLQGVKQEVLAKKMGMSQQNVSKMEKQEKVAQKRLEDAAKILGTTVKVIKEFNEKAVFNSNIAFEQNSGQTNNIGSTKEIIAYFKGELAKKDREISDLLEKLKAYERGEKSESIKTIKDGSDIDNPSKLTAVK